MKAIKKNNTAISITKQNSVFFQPKLTINNPNDHYEQEADAMADKVMRMPNNKNDYTFFKPVDITLVQRKCTKCDDEEKLHRKESGDAEIEAIDELRNYTGSMNSGGNYLSEGTRSFFEPRFGYDFSNVKIHNDSIAAKSAQSINALAYTSGNNIVFNQNQYSPETDKGKRLLGHELTHVVQQNKDHTSLIQRKDCDSPHDKMVFERAKKGLAALEPKLQALEGYQLGIESEMLRTLDDRRKIDDPEMDETIEEKWKMEAQNMSSLNKRPVTINVSGTDIIFKIKFQVFFENTKMETQFDTLATTLQAGIDLVWNHTLSKGIFSGRKFSIIPEVNLIDTLSNRSHDYWLIVIRNSDTSKVIHPGCTLPDPGTAIPTSVTDTLCDGGVISIPPAHIKNAGILGHEILHLFGLIDRYAILTYPEPATKKGAKPTSRVSLVPLRETAGRKDPLGAEDATILWEDLAYIFSELGLYSMEIAKTTPSLSILKSEARRLRRIVDHGCDPDSLIRIRKDFNDKIIKSVEDL